MDNILRRILVSLAVLMTGTLAALHAAGDSSARNPAQPRRCFEQQRPSCAGQ